MDFNLVILKRFTKKITGLFLHVKREIWLLALSSILSGCENECWILNLNIYEFNYTTLIVDRDHNFSNIEKVDCEQFKANISFQFHCELYANPWKTNLILLQFHSISSLFKPTSKLGGYLSNNATEVVPTLFAVIGVKLILRAYLAPLSSSTSRWVISS